MENAALPEAVASVAAPAVFDNASIWHNFTMWTAQHLALAVNMSRLTPSLEDLVWAGPRMVMKLGRLGSLISVPDAIDDFGQRAIPEATDTSNIFVTATEAAAANVEAFVQSITPPPSTSAAAEAAAAAAVAAAQQDPNAFVSRFSEGAKGLGSVFSYATSKWALCCIAMAVIFNRTHIFAATRRRLRLRWHVRLLLRLPPIVLLLWQARRLLQSIQCQTSPDFAQLRWGNASKSSDLMFSQTNALLRGVTSTLLFGATDEESCRSVRMVPWDHSEPPELVGSLSRLFPVFGTFCLSQFVEVLSCTLQGRPHMVETGMTLFEHSLAFAEADAAISNQLGWGMFSNTTSGSQPASGATIAVTRSMILRRVNTPPEVLLVAFLSSMSHVTSHILGLFNLQSKFRLLSTGFWALSFMLSLVWSALNFSVEDSSAQGLLRFPTVCIIGFIPHMFILAGIFTCALIYGLALALSALAAPETGPDGERLTFKQRLARAHDDMQANTSLSDIRIRSDMDFYTALLRAGFGAITMASEAVYLNEDHRVNLRRYTWLEDERFREMEELRMQWISGGIPGSRFDSVGAIGLVPIKDGQASATSGYARERAAQQVPRNSVVGRRRWDGMGAAERSSRWLMAFEYVMHITRLVLITWALCTVRVFTFLGVRNPPRWLQGLSRRPKNESSDRKRSRRTAGDPPADFMLLAEQGTTIPIRRSDKIDVERELRRRIENTIDGDGNIIPQTVDEAEVDSSLYSWWLKGGWWGSEDSSGDYNPPVRERDPDDIFGLDDDFDTTSVISSTETNVDSEFDWESDNGDDDLADGQRTPTQSTFSHQFARESTPLVDMPMAVSDLARLLNPQSPEDRAEAKSLAAHLASDGIMTRSRYRQQMQRQRAQVLLSGGGGNSAATRSVVAGRGPQLLHKMTPDEEAQQLEQLLLSRRAAAQSAGASSSWATGAAGLGPDGPQCVVCQSAPRTIIVWPCRCLSLCDECRVSLAMNNFEKCVCCRREVISFSRIYVP